jgi:hypothetical protein
MWNTARYFTEVRTEFDAICVFAQLIKKSHKFCHWIPRSLQHKAEELRSISLRVGKTNTVYSLVLNIAIMSLVLGLLFVQFIALSSAQFCDQRANGGELLCCKGANNSCWVRVPSSLENGLQAGQTRVCYCDEYCRTTGDCCPDLERVKAVCRGLKKLFCNLHNMRLFLNKF